jgi:hypothetical protein
MKYNVNNIINYPVPGVVFDVEDNVVPTSARITHVYDNIKCEDGIIVDMELIDTPHIKQITGKLLFSENYFSK